MHINIFSNNILRKNRQFIYDYMQLRLITPFHNRGHDCVLFACTRSKMIEFFDLYFHLTFIRNAVSVRVKETSPEFS